MSNMTSLILLHDVVALTEDVPSERLLRGQVGTVVLAHAPDDFEVEFSDNDEHTCALIAFKRAQLMVLHHLPLEAWKFSGENAVLELVHRR